MKKRMNSGRESAFSLCLVCTKERKCGEITNSSILNILVYFKIKDKYVILY